MLATSKLTIVCCAETCDPNWRWLENQLSDSRLRFEFAPCAPANALERRLRRINVARIRGSLAAVRLARRTRAGVLVAHSPSLAAWCSLFARALGVNVTIVANSFNFAVLPGTFKRSVFSRAFSRVHTFVVSSNFERALYARTFGLPGERFEVVYWGVQTPEVEEPEVPFENGDYACAIGGNARDYVTLLEAARRLPAIPFVLVVRPDSLRGLDLPANVRVHVDLPLAQTMNVLAHARFMVLPLRDSVTPCGHVTLVAAMHLGKTFVATDSAGVADYVHPELNSLSVPASDAEGLASAIQRLWDAPELCRTLGENGRHFATSTCSEASVAEHFRQWLDRSGLLSLQPSPVACDAGRHTNASAQPRRQSFDTKSTELREIGT